MACRREITRYIPKPLTEVRKLKGEGELIYALQRGYFNMNKDIRELRLKLRNILTKLIRKVNVQLILFNVYGSKEIMSYWYLKCM